ncbi:hypothetical protein WJX77_001571 [Trebouxia sp. C0004]
MVAHSWLNVDALVHTLVDLSDCAAVRMASSSASGSKLAELEAKLKGLEEQKAAELKQEKGTRDLELLVELNKDLDRVQAAIIALSSDPDLIARIADLEEQRQLDDGLARRLYDIVFRYSESKISKSTNRKLKGRLKAAYGKTVQGKLLRCVSHMTLNITVLWLGF